jgi:hypothetical protein
MRESPLGRPIRRPFADRLETARCAIVVGLITLAALYIGLTYLAAHHGLGGGRSTRSFDVSEGMSSRKSKSSSPSLR